jgi:hypothetical protein
MTYGQFMTLAAATTGLYAAFVHWRQLRKLPTRSEPGHDESKASPALAYGIIIVAGLALPFAVYFLFSAVDPDLFHSELF